RLDLMAARAFCNVSDLAGGQNSETFQMPTAVVSATSSATISVDIAYTDASGHSRQLAAQRTQTLTPGGTPPPPPPPASFTLTPPSIAPGGVSFMDVVLAGMAPVGGTPITVTSGDPTVASVITGGQPNLLGGCSATNGGGAATLQAGAQVAQQTT